MDEADSGDAKPPSGERSADVAKATCATGGPAMRLGAKSDIVLDLLILRGARNVASRRPDAFNSHGYKVPVALPARAGATLSVSRPLRGRVGLVYSLETQDRVNARGVSAADRVVRFTSCPATPTGWPGGLVIDRPRCATLVVKAGDRPQIRRRVPLGRPC